MRNTKIKLLLYYEALFFYHTGLGQNFFCLTKTYHSAAFNNFARQTALIQSVQEDGSTRFLFTTNYRNDHITKRFPPISYVG